MAEQTYCTQTEIEQILSEAGLLHRADDDGDVGLDSAIVSATITRAATIMNPFLRSSQYKMSDLASNEWCKWCNATIAAFLFATRAGNPAPHSLQAEYEQYLEWLQQVKEGELLISDTPSFDTRPTVTNFDPMLNRRRPSVRVDEKISSGKRPSSPIIRNTTDDPT